MTTISTSMRVVFAIFLTGSIAAAADKSPNQILSGKPAITNGGSGKFYDSHGSYAQAPAATPPALTTTMVDMQGVWKA